MSMQSEVANAAKDLDKAVPDWFKKVKVGRLDLEDGENCVLGQLYGDVWNAPKKFQNRTAFAMDNNQVHLKTPEKKKQLTDLWKSEIKNRRS